MQDELIVHDGQEGRNDFAKSLTNKNNMKDENWVDAVTLSPRQRFQALNYMELDDESLEMVIKDVRREWERRQKDRYDLAVQRRSDLELRKELQGE